MKRKPSYTAGANAERTAIVAKVRRLMRRPNSSNAIDGESLLEWLLERHARYNKRKRGIGK